MTTLELCDTTLGNIIRDLIHDQTDKGLRASGKTAATLHKQAREDGGEVLGSSAFYFQVHGRGPGKFPPPQEIIDWIESKHIEPVDISKRSLAYLIGRKIAEHGTNIFTGRAAGLALNEIVTRHTHELAGQVGRMAVEDLLKVFRSLNTSN